MFHLQSVSREKVALTFVRFFAASQYSRRRMAENYFWKRSTNSPPSLKLLASMTICRNKRLWDYTQTFNPSTKGYPYPKPVRLYLRQMRYVRLADLRMPILKDLLHFFQGEYFTAIAGGYAAYQVGWSGEYQDVDLYLCVPADTYDNDITQIVKQNLTSLQGMHPELQIDTLMTYENKPNMRMIRIRDEVEIARDLFGRRITHQKAFDIVFLRTKVDPTDDFYTLSQKIVEHFDLQISKSVGLPIYMAEDKSGILFFPLEYSEEFIYDYEFVECSRLSKIDRFLQLTREIYFNREALLKLKLLKNISKSLDFTNELFATYRVCTLLSRWKKYNGRIKSSLRMLSYDELHSTLATNAFLEGELMTWC